jgi:hypothetical protein
MKRDPNYYATKNQLFIERLNITRGTYQFTISDSYGDGICSGTTDTNSGSYTVTVGGLLVITGCNFGFGQTSAIVVVV